MLLQLTRDLKKLKDDLNLNDGLCNLLADVRSQPLRAHIPKILRNNNKKVLASFNSVGDKAGFESRTLEYLVLLYSPGTD